MSLCPPTTLRLVGRPQTPLKLLQCRCRCPQSQLQWQSQHQSQHRRPNALRSSYSTHSSPSPPLLLPRASSVPLRRRPARRNNHSLPIPATTLQFGQPTHETHPHILAAGDLTPGIPAHEYHLRRARLAALLPKKGIAVLAASDVKYKSGSVFYEYVQDRDFSYLTGWAEPESLAVVVREDGGGEGDAVEYKFWLFVRGKDRRAELWDGARNGVDAAREVWNADEAADITTLKQILPDLIASASEIYTDIKTAPPPTLLSRFLPAFKAPMPSDPISLILEKSTSKPKIRPLRPLLNTLRVTKSSSELSNMRRAGQNSARAFTATMRQSFRYERDLDNELTYQFRRHGCDGISFEPVVAGSKNALSIHYVRNDDVLREGDMVLVDGGGEYGGYIADITRTYPVSGRFSTAQKDLYEAVLSVQRDCIALCRESAQISLDRLHGIAEEGLKGNLKSLGFEMGNGAIDELFPHHLSHYIGLDVHDCAGYSRKEELREGMCVTVEPGIYVADEDRWPKHFRGMGIRIEDSVAVGREGPTVLTTEAVKEAVDIEGLR